MLTARALAPALPPDTRDENAALHVPALDWRLIPTLQTEIWKLTQRLIEVKADMRRRDLVSRDVVPQLGIVRRIPGVPRHVPTGQLLFDQIRIFSQEENASLQFHRL